MHIGWFPVKLVNVFTSYNFNHILIYTDKFPMDVWLIHIMCSKAGSDSFHKMFQKTLWTQI